MNKVSWPTRQELFRASMVVLIVIFSLAFILAVYDILWKVLLSWGSCISSRKIGAMDDLNMANAELAAMVPPEVNFGDVQSSRPPTASGGCCGGADFFVGPGTQPVEQAAEQTQVPALPETPAG